MQHWTWTYLVFIPLRLPVHPRVIHAPSRWVINSLDLAPLEQTVDLGHMRRVVRPSRDNDRVELFGPPRSVDPVALLEEFEVPERQLPDVILLDGTFDTRRVRDDWGGLVVRVQTVQGRVRADMRPDDVVRDDPSLHRGDIS